MKRQWSLLAEQLPLHKVSPIMVSACLLGVPCRYDGKDAFCAGLMDFVSSFQVIPFCPEQLGGLSTPRSPARIWGGDGRDVLAGRAKLVNALDEDVTEAFRNGAEEALALALPAENSLAIMKDKSPSCGLRTPYCETATGPGIGVTAALFESRGIRVFELGSKDVFPTHSFLRLIQ